MQRPDPAEDGPPGTNTGELLREHARTTAPSAAAPTVEAPREVHLHFHRVNADDVAVIIARQHHNG